MLNVNDENSRIRIQDPDPDPNQDPDPPQNVMDQEHRLLFCVSRVVVWIK